VIEQSVWSIDSASGVVPTSAADARCFVCRHLREEGLGHLADDIQLVVSELVTNALVHADTPFRLTLEVLEGSIVVSVCDGSSVRPFMVAAPALDTGGRGMRIVDLLSLEWGVTTAQHGGKSVWASFDIGGSPG
jgi:anti-sigma regulatory factor (Ser/Thr protein kinase)